MAAAVVELIVAKSGYLVAEVCVGIAPFKHIQLFAEI
jgi:hypothetical protein